MKDNGGKTRVNPTFEEHLLRFRNNLKIRRLRRQCYDAIDKIEKGMKQLRETEREIMEMIQ